MSATELRRKLMLELTALGQHVLAVAVDQICDRLIVRADDDDAADLGALPLWTNDKTIDARKRKVAA